MGQPFTRVVALFTPEFQDDGKATWATYEQGGQVGGQISGIGPLVMFCFHTYGNLLTFRIRICISKRNTD